jgi:hypothetical protein
MTSDDFNLQYGDLLDAGHNKQLPDQYFLDCTILTP